MDNNETLTTTSAPEETQETEDIAVNTTEESSEEETAIITPSSINIPYTLQYENYPACTKEEIEGCYNEIKELNKLESLRYYARVKAELDSCNMAEQFIETAVVTKETAMNLVNILDESTKDLMGDETESLKEQLESSDDDFDEKKFKTELAASKDRLNMAADLIRAHIAHLKEVNGDTTMAEDIIDTLLKNRKVISDGNDLNKHTYCKAIDEAIVEISNVGLAKFDEDSLRRILPKISNEKRIKELYKSMKDAKEYQKEFRKVGFNMDFVASFCKFMKTEMDFYEHELGGVAMCDEPTLITVSALFFYHIAKIVDAELHKRRYRTLVFKLYVLRPLEIDKMYPVKEFKDNDTGMVPISRWEDDGCTQTEASLFRQKVFHVYEKVLQTYISAIPNIVKDSRITYAKAQTKRK